MTTQARRFFEAIMLHRCRHYTHVGQDWNWVADAVHARYPEISHEEAHAWVRERNTDPKHTCWEHAP